MSYVTGPAESTARTRDALPDPAKGFADKLRIALIVGGVLSVVLGLLILIAPVRTAEVFTAIIAAWMLIGGIVYASLGVFSRNKGGWARVGYVLLGLLAIIVGVVAFSNLAIATVSFALFLGSLVGILWIVEGAVSLSTLGQSRSRGWTIAFAILSIVAGIMLLFSPLWGAIMLWWLLGISAIALGIVNIVRGASARV